MANGSAGVDQMTGKAHLTERLLIVTDGPHCSSQASAIRRRWMPPASHKHGAVSSTSQGTTANGFVQCLDQLSAQAIGLSCRESALG